MKFLSDIEVEEGLRDKDGGLGADGQILSSTGSLTSWIDATSGSIGGSIADNQIAVGASTANTIEGSSNFTYTGSVFTVKGRMVLSDDLTTAAPNIYMGKDAGINSDLTGSPLPSNNIGIGRRALEQLTQGGSNIAIGAGALRSATENSSNVAIGGNALFYLDGVFNTSSYNTVIGTAAGQCYGATFTLTDFVTTGSENVFLGWKVRPLANNPENQIIIGYDAVGGGDNTITLGNGDITTFRIPGLNATNNQVLTYNATAGGFKAAAAAGGGIGGATVATQVAFGAASSTTDITSDSTFTFIKTGTGSGAQTLLEVGDGDSSEPTSKGSVFITAKQVNDSTSRARFQLYSEANLRGYLQCSGTSSAVTLLGVENLVLSAGAKVQIDGGSTSTILIASASGSNVGIGNTSPAEKLDVTGRIKASAGVQVGNETGTSAVAGLVGTLRYRTYSDASFDYSAVDVCMQDGPGAGDYDWVNIVTKRWV